MECTVMQCNAMQCNAMQCNVMYVCVDTQKDSLKVIHHSFRKKCDFSIELVPYDPFPTTLLQDATLQARPIRPPVILRCE